MLYVTICLAAMMIVALDHPLVEAPSPAEDGASRRLGIQDHCALVLPMLYFDRETPLVDCGTPCPRSIFRQVYIVDCRNIFASVCWARGFGSMRKVYQTGEEEKYICLV
jgi:hypothetical protein